MSTTTNALNNTATVFDVDNLRLDGNSLSSTNTNGNIVLAPNGAGEISVTAAPIVPSTDRADSLGSATNAWDNVFCDGVSFDDGTNILSNYEEGTWTPVLNFGGATTGISYTLQEGYYTRIGRCVYFQFYILLSSKGSATGTGTLTGLPYNALTSTFENNCVLHSAFTLPASISTLFSASNVGSTTLNLLAWGAGAAGTWPTDTAYTNIAEFSCAGFYFI